MSARIMIVDDEPAIRESLQGLFEDENYIVTQAPSGEEAVARFRKQPVDCVLLDIWMPGIDGLEAMLRLHQIDNALPIIIMSGHATIDTAVRATRQGAFDFVEKPLSSDKLLILVRNALEKRKLTRENTDLKQNIHQQSRHELMGESNVICNVRALIKRVAAADTAVLLLGEHGTGKAVAARLLHLQSKRSEAPFMDLNIASIPDGQMDSELFGHEKGAFPGALHTQRGRFEACHGGSLFFDEIGELSLSSQAKILRAMQERRVQRLGNPSKIPANVRILGASSSSPEHMLKQGVLREDFYYRLNIITIQLPSLRERMDDLPLLTQTLAAEQADLLGGEAITFSESAQAVMADYKWGGNIRELRNYIERCHILWPSELITAKNMPPLDATSPTKTVNKELDADGLENNFNHAREHFERSYLQHYLDKHDWNISRTAADIDMDRSQLHRKIKHFSLSQMEKKE
ncbi:MAG: sigma-54 dependent transcriptional regulator [Mariprofundaceae bacterium]|nr:sigma-54 dependent transcriptional regulator [Mariprofundaceae bacterium]